MILLVGPMVPPVNGQSLAFTRFVNSIPGGYKIIINTVYQGSSRFMKPFFVFFNLFFIILRASFNKYDVVYFTCSRTLFGSVRDVLLILISSFRGKKVVNHLHGSDFYEFIHKSPFWLEKILLYSYSRVHTSIVLLESMRDQFQDFDDMLIEVVPNFFDENLSKELDSVKGDENNSFIEILFLSNIMETKGIFDLIDAFAALSIQYPNIRLSVAGAFLGDDQSSARAVEKKFNDKILCCNRIRYVGKVFGSYKARLLHDSDIFVLPTYYKSEAFPISVIEAMACSNAIVTTRHKYLPNIISNNNGLLVRPKMVTDLADAIEVLLLDKERLKNCQEFNRSEAHDLYSLESYLNNLHRVVFKK